MKKIFLIEILTVYCVEATELNHAVDKAKNMVIGESSPVVDKLTPTGRYATRVVS